MIDPKLKTLLCVVKEGSYTKAADVLALSQPAVSYHVRQLEDEIGIKIFYKNQKKLTLTPEGEVLLKYARRLEAISDSARRALADVHGLAERLLLVDVDDYDLVRRVLDRHHESDGGADVARSDDGDLGLHSSFPFSERVALSNVFVPAIYHSRKPPFREDGDPACGHAYMYIIFQTFICGQGENP